MNLVQNTVYKLLISQKNCLAKGDLFLSQSFERCSIFFSILLFLSSSSSFHLIYHIYKAHFQYSCPPNHILLVKLKFRTHFREASQGKFPSINYGLFFDPPNPSLITPCQNISLYVFIFTEHWPISSFLTDYKILRIWVEFNLNYIL